MDNEQLEYILKSTDLSQCDELIEDYIYYCDKKRRQISYRGDGTYYWAYFAYEYLIIAPRSEKRAIIAKYEDGQIQWLVSKGWRGKSILSNALRTGIVHSVWPDIRKIKCCYERGENKEEKYRMTKHLAELAGLELE